MSSNNFIDLVDNGINGINNAIDFSNKDTGNERTKKVNGNKIVSNIKEINHKKEKNIITGDRFIPLKNGYESNVQNFILNSSSITFNSINSPQKNDSISSSEGKIEKNYVNFIIDNMLKISSDKFVVKNNDVRRNNNIYSFSKRIYKKNNEFNSKKNLENKNNTEKDKNNNLNIFENYKKIKNNEEEMKNNNDESEEDLYNHINSFYRKEKNILSKDKYYETGFNKIFRKIPKTPFRILDAPNLVDDYYLNLLDWGKENIIAVALSEELYLWNENNSKSTLLMTYENNNMTSEDSNNNNNITSVSWMQNGFYLGIGLPDGIIQLWDINKKIKLREIEAHNKRVSCLSWNNNILSSGSKDAYIKNFDIRLKYPEISKIKKHKQEICSLRYSIEGDLLASGGNDNMAYIWDVRNFKNNIFNFLLNDNSNNNPYEIKPYCINNLHQAAVKAMNWCPWKRHVLATGGGSKDKSIKIFSCDNNKLIRNIDTGSQVCALVWNEKEKEIISSHGYNKNQIIIWNYKKNKKICELKGHMNRVLYMVKSPDEKFICTGSGDETLRFWKINDERKEKYNLKEEDEMINNILVH